MLFVSLHGDPRTEYPVDLGHADETGVGAGVGVAVGAGLLGERYPPLVWGGVALIALGIGLTVWARRGT